jgi:hypothetical protein
MHLKHPFLALALLSTISSSAPVLAQSDVYGNPGPNTMPVYPPGVQPATTAAYPPAPSPMPMQGQMQAMPMQGQMPSSFGGPAQQGMQQQAPKTVSIGEWFNRYDMVRYRAQMNPAERKKADEMLSKGLSLIVPGEEKQSTQALLLSLVQRYQRAANELKTLPMIKPTQQLHQGYYQYFVTAGKLFSDYVAVQNNLFATDQSGQLLSANLLQRKQGLETLERSCKQLDGQLRQQYNIAPYPY